MTFAVPRTPARNIQVYNPTPNSLNVRWEPASGQVQQYRVAYSSLSAARSTGSVSNSLQALKTQTVISSARGLGAGRLPPEITSLLRRGKEQSTENCRDQKQHTLTCYFIFKLLENLLVGSDN